MCLVEVLYINLDSSTDRRAHIEANLAKCGITSFTRIPAFDGRGIPVDSLPDHDGAAMVSFMGRPLSGGEYGCYKSHLQCLSHFLNGTAQHCLLLEDDVEFDIDFREGVDGVLDVLAASGLDWDVTHLSPTHIKIFTPVATVGNHRKLMAAHYFPMNTSALLWSRNGASGFLARHAKVNLPIDVQLREAMLRSGKGFAVWPPLAQAADLDSDIDAPRELRRSSGRRWFYGVAKQRRLFNNKIMALLRAVQFRRSRRRAGRIRGSVGRQP